MLKSFTLFQIVSWGTMDLAPLLRVFKVLEMPICFQARGLLATILTISVVLAISPIGHVDLPIILLLLWGPLATGLKESSSGLRCLDACVCDCEQIDHRLGFFIAISTMDMMSLTPLRKALMISMSWMYGIAFLVLQKYFT
jgi:hypothetical protein